MSHLKQLVLWGAVWLTVGLTVGKSVQWLGNLLLTRLLLPPELFGLLAVASAPVTAITLLSNIGLNVSVVQNQRGNEPSFLNTIWTIQIVRGLGAWLICLLLAFPIASFYREPTLVWLVPVCGVNLLIAGFNSTALYSLERSLTFRKLVIFTLTIEIITTTVMVVMGWFNFGLWSVIGKGLSAALLTAIWSHRLIPGQSNRLAWDRRSAREIFTLGSWIWLSILLAFITTSSQQFLLERFTSLQFSELYRTAVLWSSGVLPTMIAIYDRLMIPAFSRLAEQPRAVFRSKILRNRKFLVVALAVGMAGAIGFADWIVSTLYDSRYADVGWILQFLLIGVWFRLLCGTIEPALYAIGDVRSIALAHAAGLGSALIAIPAGFALLGQLGAVMGIALSNLFYYTIVNYALRRSGLGCWRQDLKATGLFLSILAVIVTVMTMV